MKKKYPLRSACPCGSDKTYKECCKKRKIEWFIDGEVASYSVPINDEAMEVVLNAQKLFIKTFKRKPVGDDPFLISLYLFSDKDFMRDVVDVMKKSGIREELIYAFQATDGLMLTAENIPMATQSKIDDWNRAILEYRSGSYEKINRLEKNVDEFCSLLQDCIFAFGLLKDKFLNSHKYENLDNPIFIQAFYIVKSFSSLKTVYSFLEKDVGEDSLSILRTVYENYLHIVFLKNCPDRIVEFLASCGGVDSGIFEYCKGTNGRDDFKKILDKRTGIVYKKLTNYKLVEVSHKEDIELFDHLYAFLSDFIHPSVMLFDNYLQSCINKYGSKVGRLNYQNHNHKDSAGFFSVIIASMILDEVSYIVDSKLLKRDIRIVVKRVATLYFKLIKDLPDDHFYMMLSARMRLMKKL